MLKASLTKFDKACSYSSYVVKHTYKIIGIGRHNYLGAHEHGVQLARNTAYIIGILAKGFK